MWPDTRLCELFGIEHPIVQAPMMGSCTPALASAVANAGGMAMLTGLSFPVVWVAFAPGGVEGMAAIGLALGFDPAFVATHHIFCIVLVIALLPLAVRLAGR